MHKKSIFFLIMLCAFSYNGLTQIVSTEGFESTTFAPTGWSIKVNLAPAQNVWIRQNAPTTNPSTTAHGGTAVARFRRGLTAGTKQILITRPIDYTNRGTSNANVDFWMYRDSLVATNYDSLTVWVNSTDTLDATAVKLGTIARNRSIPIPDTQAVNGWYHFVYAIPATFTGTTTRFIFEGTSGTTVAGQGANIFIDDVSFDEFPAVCIGTPNVGNIVNPTPLICGGTGSATLSLTAPITGLLGITYSWESSATASGPWLAVGTNSATLNTGTVSSTTFYQCTVNCSFSGLTYITPIDSIVVSTLAPPVVSATPSSVIVCAGGTGAQIIATGAVSYSWTPATGLNTTIGDTVIANPLASAQYLVLGSDSAGCSDTATVNVVFNAGPSVNISATPNDSVFCQGSQVILNSVFTGTTGNTYLWSDGVTTRRDTIIVTSTTTYSVIVTNSAGCSNTDSFTVTAISGPVANFGWTHSGNTFTFSDSSTTATNWTWTFGDGNGSSNQNPIYTFSTPGTYTVTLIISGTPCNLDDTITKVILISPESVNDISNQISLNYYPNPVQEVLNISLISTGNIKTVDAVMIRNNMGQKVLSYQNTTDNKLISIPVKSLSSGLYFVEIFSNGQIYPFKFMKQ